MADDSPKGHSETAVSKLVSGTTSGVKGIEKAWERAGGTAHHTPGGAGRLGSAGQHGANTWAREGRSENGKRAEPSAFGRWVAGMLNGRDTVC